MGARSLFNLILKVIGLFFLRDILEAFSHTLSAALYFPEYESLKEALVNVAVSLPPLILYVVLAWLFLFKSDKLVHWLKLDKNLSSSTISISADRSRILTAAVIIAGGWVLVNEIPEFFRHAVYYYQERKLYIRMTRPDISYIIMSAIKIAIGLMLVVFNKPIVGIIEWSSKSHLPWQKTQGTEKLLKADKHETANSD